LELAGLLKSMFVLKISEELKKNCNLIFNTEFKEKSIDFLGSFLKVFLLFDEL